MGRLVYKMIPHLHYWLAWMCNMIKVTYIKYGERTKTKCNA